MRFGETNIYFSDSARMYLVVCLFTSVVFAFLVSFHDYLPAHSPAYLLMAEDKLKPLLKARHLLRTSENLRAYAFLNTLSECGSVLTAPDSYASSTYFIFYGSSSLSETLLSLSADLSPPAVYT